MKMRSLAGAAVLACMTCQASSAHAADAQFYGLLRSRDLTPFGFLRLDMRPAYAVSIEEGTWSIEVELGYQNTWALSEQVENYLTSLESAGRRVLGPADVQAIRDLPGENYLLDLESALLDVTFHYKLSDDWTGYLILGAVSYHGGFLDGTIEGFHDMFGFSSFGRPAVSKNDVNLICDLKSSQVTSFGTPTRGGFMDPTIGARYAGFQLPEHWALSVEAAVKTPISGARKLLSTGKADYGLQASLQRRGAHHALYLDVAAVYYSGAEFPIPQDSQVLPTLIIGYEYRLTDRTNVNVQAYISESVYSDDQTDLDELTGEKYQYSIGLRHRIDQVLLTFGLTENVQNVNNTPDVGFQFGVAYIPYPAR